MLIKIIYYNVKKIITIRIIYAIISGCNIVPENEEDFNIKGKYFIIYKDIV